MAPLYQTLHEQAASLAESEFVASLKHPVLLLDMVDDDAEFTAHTQLTVPGRPAAMLSAADQVARLIAKPGHAPASEPITLGRAESCDIVVDDPSISKVHAHILVGRDGSVAIVDADSRHGVFVNGHRVSSSSPTRLTPADELRLGTVEASLVYPAPLYRLLRGETRLSLWRSLRSRPFAFLWAGQSISWFGDNLFRIALTWWVLERTGSGLAMGAVAMCQIVPMTVFLLIGGVIVDRFSRARVLLVSDTSRAILTTVLAALAFSDRLEVWHVYVISTLFGLVDAFFQPAFNAIVPQLVRRRDLSSANALTTASANLGWLGGVAVGAVLVALGGTAVTFAIDALTFVVSAGCLIPVLLCATTTTRKTPVMDARGAFRDLREGIATVTADPWLWITIGMFALGQGIDLSLATVTFPFLIRDTLHQGVGALGFVQSAMALGSVIGTIWLGRRLRLRNRGLIWYLTATAVGLCLALFGLPITIYGIAAGALLRGIGFAVMAMLWLDTIQQRVPAEKLGRVSSIEWFACTAVIPVGLVVVGWLTDHFPPQVIFIVGGIGYMALAVVALLRLGIKTVD